MRVFIADDSQIMRERLKEMLSETPGVEIIGEAGQGGEAIRDIIESKPDVVILDIRMPGGNGIDVLQAIKKGDPAPTVIMLTNYPYPQYRKKCMGLGADYFFDKYSEFERLMEMIEQLNRDSQ